MMTEDITTEAQQACGGRSIWHRLLLTRNSADEAVNLLLNNYRNHQSKVSLRERSHQYALKTQRHDMHKTPHKQAHCFVFCL